MGPSSNELIDALFASDDLWVLAGAIPQTPPEVGGRPRDFPDWAYLLFGALVVVFKSARRTEAEVTHPVLWRRICDLASERFPDDSHLRLRLDKPLRRHHWSHMKKKFNSSASLRALQDQFEEQAAKAAKAIGLFPEGGKRSSSHPQLCQAMHGDGKVVTPRYKARSPYAIDPKTRRRRRTRVDPDAASYRVAGGREVFGTKFVWVLARGSEEHSRIVLGLDHCGHNEARIGVEIAVRAKSRLRTAEVVGWDGALRGTHINELLQAGLLTCSPVTAASGGRGSDEPRKEKEPFIQTVRLRLTSGVYREESLFAIGGSPALLEPTQDGRNIPILLKRTKTYSRRNSDGSYRWYGDYVHPDNGATLTGLRLDTSEQDRERGLNRAEVLRAIPPGDNDYDRLFNREL